MEVFTFYMKLMKNMVSYRCLSFYSLKCKIEFKEIDIDYDPILNSIIFKNMYFIVWLREGMKWDEGVC